MKKMICQNWFVLRKNRSTIVIPIILILFGFLSAYMESTAEEPTEMVVGSLFTQIFGQCLGIAMMMCGIGSVLFLRSDLNNGFIKNIAGNVRSDAQYFIPKIMVLAANNLLLLFSLVGGVLIGCTAFLNGLADFDALVFFKYFSAAALLLTGISVLLTFIVFAVRSGSVPMALAIVICTGLFANLFYPLLSFLLSKIGISFDCSKYSITLKLSMLSPAASNQELISACILAVGYVLVFGILTKLVLAKKDAA